MDYTAHCTIRTDSGCHDAKSTETETLDNLKDAVEEIRDTKKEEQGLYDEKFVDKVLGSKNSKGEQIKIEDLWKE